jgi:hypothetical protein
LELQNAKHGQTLTFFAILLHLLPFFGVCNELHIKSGKKWGFLTHIYLKKCNKKALIKMIIRALSGFSS